MLEWSQSRRSFSHTRHPHTPLTPLLQRYLLSEWNSQEWWGRDEKCAALTGVSDSRIAGSLEGGERLNREVHEAVRGLRGAEEGGSHGDRVSAR